jgi:cobalamin biosynthesis Mg chelatase CobN
MPNRLPLLLALVTVLALPAGAHASDPLLSGYAGPGGGEQVVLGGTTVGSDKTPPSGGSGTTSAAATGATAQQSLKAAPTSTASGAASSSNLSRKPQRKKSSSSASKQKADDTSSTSATTTAPTAAIPSGAPVVVTYPTRAGEVGGLPVSAVGVLLGVLGLAALVLAGLGLRRLSSASDPQVSAS